MPSHILQAFTDFAPSAYVFRPSLPLALPQSGHQPMVRVWDSEERVQVTEFDGHNFGVRCVSFSPSGRYLVSIGSQYDMMVNVWDWKHALKISSNKVSSKVNAMAFSENGHCFLTVGNRHVRFWYMDNSRAKVSWLGP